MTTLVGGQTFNYLDAREQVVRIRLIGNITAEFTAARVNGSDNRVVIRDLIAPSPPGVTPAVTEGADLFNIYIAEADANASIQITRVANLTAADTTATPYGGSVGTFRGLDNETIEIDPGTGEPVDGGGGENNGLVPTDAVGSVWLGARTNDLEGIDGNLEAAVPIIFNRTRQGLGVRPASRGLYAGIQTAPGVSVGKVLIGGTVTGIVNFQASIRTFYAGNVLTGNTSGLATDFFGGIGGIIGGGVGSAPIRNNFQVGGDIQNFYVGGSVGTNAAGNYSSGFELRVGGRVGNFHVVNSFNGSVAVFNNASSLSLNVPFQEQESIGVGTAGAAFLAGRLTSGIVLNNAETNAPFGYTTNGGISWQGTVVGSAAGDGIDNYSLPLLAGQKVTLELQSQFAGVQLGVYDPLGRLLATDLSTATFTATGQQIQVTADLPGIYRLAVVGIGDNTFTGGAGGDTYTLNALNVGDMPFGGATVGGVTRFRNSGNGVAVRKGDLGAWYGSGNITGNTLTTNGVSSPIYLSRGNLRALYGNSIGVEIEASFLTIAVPRGSVGYIRAANDLLINPDAVFLANDPDVSQAIGGDIQRVEVGDDLQGNLVVNGNIGTIIAGTINSPTVPTDPTDAIVMKPTISVNTDNVGEDGFIDMIYVTGDVGVTGIGGGPAIFTGRAGNLKYFHVGGDANRDSFFGGSLTTEQSYLAGQSVRLTDDSGAVAVISPTSQIRTTTTTTTGGTTTVTTDQAAVGETLNDPTSGTTLTPIDENTTSQGVLTTTGALTIRTYGVRTGGSAVISIDTSTNIRVTTVAGTGGSFDVSDISVLGNGSPVLATTTTTNTPTTGTVNVGTVGFSTATATDIVGGAVTAATLGTTPLRNNRTLFAGPLPVNVFNVAAGAVNINITAMANSTAGEIASTTGIASLGYLTANNVGRINRNTQADVIVPANLSLTIPNYSPAASPFNEFSNGISVDGSVIAVSTSQGIGNVQVADTIGVVQPNNDGRNARGVFDGIDGVVEAEFLNTVVIGEGIAFGGSGSFVRAGVFADTNLNNVIGNNADVRGPIVARGQIGTINLTNGSIINTRVGTFNGYDQALYTTSTFLNPDPSGTYSLNRLNISGNGGIIGSNIIAGSFLSIEVGGFGIISSVIATTAANNINGSIRAGGLGIRYSVLDVGSSVGTIAATGDGKVLDISQYSSTVRQTSKNSRLRFDAYSGQLLDGTNDLNRLLGTSASQPKKRGVTNSGVFQDNIITGQGDLGNLQAYAIASTDFETPVVSSAFPMRISVANTIGNIDVINGISGLQLTSGSLDTMTVGGNVARMLATVSGNIGDISVGKNVRGTVTFSAVGDEGSIASVVVRGSLFGNVFSDDGIGTIAAGSIGAFIATSGAIGRVGITEDLLQGATIRARRAIDRVVIGGDIQQGAKIDAQSIGVFRLGGVNNGEIILEDDD